MSNEVIVRFDKVSFDYGPNKPILNEVDFSVRRGSKVTIMGQNGAGKSTIFQLITGAENPQEGSVSTGQGVKIAIAKQVIRPDQLNLTVREFFQNSFKEKVYDIDPKIDAVLEVVNLSPRTGSRSAGKAGHDKLINTFSGGQQARILLASALIQDSDLLLLDEPTNNLDKAGIAHLTDFLVNYKKTAIVISHDSAFLNTFTDSVLYLDLHTKKVERFEGNYYDVVEKISAKIEKDNSLNARMQKGIIEKKEKANFFANKGGRLRLLAKRMREAAEEMEEAKVDIRREDKTIRNFTIPAQEDVAGEVLKITSLGIVKNHKPVKIKANISLRKNQHLLISGPNGIGKSTLLESLVKNTAEGAKITPGIVVGYYKQDFATMNFDDSVYKMLSQAAGGMSEQQLRSLCAGFLISADLLHSKIGSLSEGQKGLVSLISLVLRKPGLLILDEPTNHMNFRHLPVIARALDEYKGAMILVSHVPEFVSQIRIDETLDLDR